MLCVCMYTCVSESVPVLDRSQIGSCFTVLPFGTDISVCVCVCVFVCVCVSVCLNPRFLLIYSLYYMPTRCLGESNRPMVFTAYAFHLSFHILQKIIICCSLQKLKSKQQRSSSSLSHRPPAVKMASVTDGRPLTAIDTEAPQVT